MPLERAQLVFMLARSRGSCKARILCFLARLYAAARSYLKVLRIAVGLVHSAQAAWQCLQCSIVLVGSASNTLSCKSVCRASLS